MKTKLLMAFWLFALHCIAQKQYNKSELQNYLQTQPTLQAHAPQPHSAARSGQQAIALDYDGIDQDYASTVTGTDYTRYAWLLNKRFQPTDLYTLKYAFVNFDSILYLDNFGIPVSIPLQSVTMHLDSITLPLSYENVTGSHDTITISIYQRSSVQVSGAGTINGSHSGTVIWSNKVEVSSSLTSNGNLTTYTWFPNLQFNQGETFSVRIDFSGDTANHFNIMCGSRDDCAGSCISSLSRVKGNTECFLNWTSTNINTALYTDQIFFDCNSTGVYEESACENIFLQNVSIISYITADVNLSATFPNSFFAICNGQNQLPLTVYGAEAPTTYAWSPSNGLSDTTIQQPLITSLVNPVTYTVTVTSGNSETVTASIYVTPNQSSCTPADTIKGMVYFDTNNNGQRDSSEGVAPGILISINNTQYVRTDSNGMYTAVRLETPGSYVVKVAQPVANSWFTQPTSFGIYSLASGPNRTNINFGIHVSPDSNNVRLDLVNYYLVPRPGFNSSYRLYCENTLGSPFSGVVQFKYDALQTFQSSSTIPDNVDLALRTLSWNVNNLPAGTQAIFDITLKTQATGSFGHVVTETATVIPDVAFNDIDSFDNIAILEELVVGSYDPNDKTVSPAGQGPANSIKPDANTTLTYTIRFQNTGNFYAENVTVTDTLDSDLDLATFEMVKASHNYLLDKNNNILAWHFNQIMLPDSFTNEPGSHGFIQYKIKPKQNIADLSVIENTAFIYFDYNEAVVTNTTSNLVDFSLGLNAISNNQIGVRVYPNPFAGQTNFAINSNLQDLTLRITDITGRVVDERKNVSTPLYTYQSDLITKGLYNFELKNADGVKARGKLMVQ